MWVCAFDHAPHETLKVAYQDSWRLSACSGRRRCQQGLRQRSGPRSGRWCRCAYCCWGGSRPGPAGRSARPARPASPACCLWLRLRQAQQLRPLLLLQAAHEQVVSETTHHLSGQPLSGCPDRSLGWPCGALIVLYPAGPPPLLSACSAICDVWEAVQRGLVVCQQARMSAPCTLALAVPLMCTPRTQAKTSSGEATDNGTYRSGGEAALGAPRGRRSDGGGARLGCDDWDGRLRGQRSSLGVLPDTGGASDQRRLQRLPRSSGLPRRHLQPSHCLSNQGAHCRHHCLRRL